MKYVKGNLLDATEDYIAHGCNAQGVMGSGVALAIKNKWPEVYLEYVREIKDGMRLGDHQVVSTNDGHKVVNLITQQNFGSDGKRYMSYFALTSAMTVFLEDVMLHDHSKENFTVALPKIGAGLGGGNWDFIEAILQDMEIDLNGFVEFVVYEL